NKSSITSSAIASPELIQAGAEKFGSQCIVVSIDAKKVAGNRWEVFAQGGRKATGMEAVEWAHRAVSLGAGEIVLNSIDADGTKAGFDLEITRRVSDAVTVPVVASGGAGDLEHMAQVVGAGRADGRSAARRKGGCSARGEHLSLRSTHRWAGQRFSGGEKHPRTTLRGRMAH